MNLYYYIFSLILSFLFWFYGYIRLGFTSFAIHYYKNHIEESALQDERVSKTQLRRWCLYRCIGGYITISLLTILIFPFIDLGKEPIMLFNFVLLVCSLIWSMKLFTSYKRDLTGLGMFNSKN